MAARPSLKKQYPEPTVGVLIQNAEGKILLIKSYKWKGSFVLPAGHIDLGESIEDAVKREAKEETGLDVKDLHFLCFHEFRFDPLFHEKKHFIGFNYSCRAKSTSVKLNSEGQEYVWVSPQQVLKFQTDPYTRKTVEIFLKSKEK